MPKPEQSDSGQAQDASPQQSKRAIQAATREVTEWFERLGRKPFAFQKKCWNSFLAGNHGLLHSPTGSGKTLAVFLGPVIQQLAVQSKSKRRSSAASLNKVSESEGKPRRPIRKNSRLRVLWLTPLRALATDTEENLTQVITDLGLPWYVEKRTGDTSSAVRSRQRIALPEVLITTPESLSLMLSHADVGERFEELSTIIVDEWHELLGTKRGVQTELALARVRKLKPTARVWGLSATLGNMDQAAQALFGPNPQRPVEMLQSRGKNKLKIEALIPENMERFPWAGHLGTRLAGDVAQIVRESQSVLVFTNTRAQTEHWYRSLLSLAPELAGLMAVHHGSLDQKLRWWIEDQLRAGKLKCCVCTSSLDLGVDFSSVERVIQIGSPKGAARLLQRAGRSGHQPGATSQITFVPTNAVELIEFAALRDAIKSQEIESREAISKPLDVLAQHVVTIAIGGGFISEELLEEVRTTLAFENLTAQEWDWVLNFCLRGGSSLEAYPDYHRIKLVDGRYILNDPALVRRHRMSIGTITSDAALPVKYLKGKSIGTVEESFIGRMKPGDQFMLGGKTLKLVRVHDNTAWVRKAKGKATAIPRWSGGRMPLSSQLSHLLRAKLDAARANAYHCREMKAVRPMLEIQDMWSSIPGENELLIEKFKNRDGHHLFVYPFDGRLVHEGLAALFAMRLSKRQPISFSMAMNDYGFVLVSPTAIQINSDVLNFLLSDDNIATDILSSLNASEMSKRQFREIARVAGLVFSGFPGQRNSSKHLQASSNMFFEVFTQYDPENMLLRQARSEVLQQQLQHSRLQASVERMQQSRWIINDLSRPSPLAFALIADKLRDRVSSETFAQRIQRLQQSLEKAATAR